MPLIYTVHSVLRNHTLVSTVAYDTQSLLELLSSPSEDMGIKSGPINYLKYKHVQVSAIKYSQTAPCVCQLLRQQAITNKQHDV